MKIYSDTLTREDLAATLPPDVTFASIEPIRNPRVRRNGWTVHLEGYGARHTRRVNSGEYGSGYHGAATYDDHGVWFARLYDLDPDARLSWWKDRDDFDRGTDGKYAEAVKV